MSHTPNTAIAVIGIDIGKNSFHVESSLWHRVRRGISAWLAGGHGRACRRRRLYRLDVCRQLHDQLGLQVGPACDGAGLGRQPGVVLAGRKNLSVSNLGTIDDFERSAIDRRSSQPRWPRRGVHRQILGEESKITEIFQ